MMQGVMVGDVQEIKIKQINNGQLDLDLYLPVENSGNMNIKLSRMDLDLKLNGVELGKLTNSEKVIIYKNTDEIYKLPVEVEIKGLLVTTLALVSLAGKNVAEYQLTGDLRVKFLCIKKDFHIDEKGDLDLR